VRPAATATARATVAPVPHAHSNRNAREFMRFAPGPNNTARDGLVIDILRSAESDS
jgi:hypothetical protein